MAAEIVDRDRALLDAAEAYRRNLPPGRLSLTEIGALDRFGLPITVASFTSDDGWLFDGFGYGLTRPECAVGALGELSEDAHGHRYAVSAPRVEGSYAELVRRRGDRGVADPLTLCLPAGSGYVPERPMHWVEARRWPSGEPVLVPEEWLACASGELRGAKPLIVPITNGRGAGPNVEHALSHALLELLQRDGNGLRFRALDRGEAIEIDELADPRVRGLLGRFDALGIEVIPKLASTEFGVANLYAVSADRDPEADLPIKQTACGEAAHPDRARALRKALCECAAARTRKAFMHGPLDAIARVAGQDYLDRYLDRLDLDALEPRSLGAMVEWIASDGHRLRGLLAETVMARRSSVPLSSLPTADVPDAASTLRHVADRLMAEGFEILAFDTSPPGGEVVTCKAVVPGLEVETMSYRRIGERGVRKLLESGSPIAGVSDPPAGALPVRLTDAAIERLGGPAWLDPGALDAAVGPLYPLYREPVSHAAQVALARRADAAIR